jgi:hypothetical protein
MSPTLRTVTSSKFWQTTPFLISSQSFNFLSPLVLSKSCNSSLSDIKSDGICNYKSKDEILINIISLNQYKNSSLKHVSWFIYLQSSKNDTLIVYSESLASNSSKIALTDRGTIPACSSLWISPSIVWVLPVPVKIEAQDSKYKRSWIWWYTSHLKGLESILRELNHN